MKIKGITVINLLCYSVLLHKWKMQNPPPPTDQPAHAPPPYGHPDYPPPPPQVIVHQPPPPPTVCIANAEPIPGACPVCRNTMWTQYYPCMAWFIAIMFFPLGILCCMMMSQKVCSKCGLRIST